MKPILQNIENVFVKLMTIHTLWYENRRGQTFSAKIINGNCNFLNVYKKRHILKPKENVMETSCPICGELEDGEYFVMRCECFSALRDIMFENICEHTDVNECDISYSTILWGDDEISHVDKPFV